MNKEQKRKEAFFIFYESVFETRSTTQSVCT